MDPGHLDSHDWSVKLVRDMVRRYDGDAIHIEDYFYTYRERDGDGDLIDLQDSVNYASYVEKYGEIDRDDWQTDVIPGWKQQMELVPAREGVGLSAVVVTSVNQLGLESDPVVVGGN